MKKFCVLQVTPYKPNKQHIELFANKKESDFYFVTHDKPNPDALKFCPNTHWNETRDILIDLVPKNYEYYAFVDYDYNLRTRTDKNFYDQLINDLNKFNPSVLIPYPGKGNSTDLVNDEKFFKERCYSINAFTHCGLKVIHHSLLKWFFPMTTGFHHGWAASHFFNILEIPFLSSSITSHLLIYDNEVNNPNSTHNKNAEKILDMHKLWMWLRPYFNKRHLLNQYTKWNKLPKNIEEKATYTDAFDIKKYYVDYYKKLKISPKVHKRASENDFFDLDLISEYFDLNHRFFKNKIYGEDRTENLIVVGNGPSLKDDYFNILNDCNADTFGMNSMYRYFDKLQWSPTFFCCFDYAVIHSHKNEWEDMIINDNYNIEKYFFIERPSLESKLNNTLPYFKDSIEKHKKFVGQLHNQDGIGYPEYGIKSKKMSCTGLNAVRRGIEMGYKNIILIGHDMNYQDINMFNKSNETNWRVKLNETPKENPNYFFNDYQQKGDIFHKPGDGVKSWDNLAELTKKYAKDVKIINCSKESRIECFKKEDFYKCIKENAFY